MTAQSLTKTLKVALICAAGVGARAGGDVPKQYQLIHGVPMLVHTVRAFERSCVDAVCVVISPDDAWYDECVAPLVGTAVQVLRVGGTSRASSVANGLLALEQNVVKTADASYNSSLHARYDAFTVKEKSCRLTTAPSLKSTTSCVPSKAEVAVNEIGTFSPFSSSAS